MSLILGMQCVYDGSLARSPERLARLADLVADPRWFYRFKLVQPATIPQMPDAPRFPGQVGAGRLRDAAREALSSPSTDSILFSMSKKEVGDHADFNVPTGRRVIYESGSTYSANAKWRLPETPDPEAAAAAWVELQHAIVATLGAMHGVIVTGTNAWVIQAEIWLSLTSVDGKVMHPRPEEIQSYAAKRHLLGTQYIRKPRWGTYLKPAHVEAVGGRDKLLEVVRPPVVRDVGDLLYVQLSERVADATSEETRARYRAFVDLVAPITMPPLVP